MLPFFLLNADCIILQIPDAGFRLICILMQLNEAAMLEVHYDADQYAVGGSQVQ